MFPVIPADSRSVPAIPGYSQAPCTFSDHSGGMDTLTNHLDQLALYELAYVDTIDLSQDVERRMQIRVQLGTHVFSVERHSNRRIGWICTWASHDGFHVINSSHVHLTRSEIDDLGSFLCSRKVFSSPPTCYGANRHAKALGADLIAVLSNVIRKFHTSFLHYFWKKTRRFYRIHSVTIHGPLNTLRKWI